MNTASPHFSILPGGQTGRNAGPPPGRDLQQVWFSLARKRWASVVLVPTDEGIPVGAIAAALAEVGTRLRDSPVTAIVADQLDYGAARTLADMQPRLFVQRALAAPLDLPANVAAGSGVAAATELEATPQAPADAHLFAPMSSVVVAIPPVVVEPLGVAVAQSADVVVLCVQMGTSRLRAARRTIELIGADRIAGAITVR